MDARCSGCVLDEHVLVAGALGVISTQFVFLSHEAAHRQVFASQRWNDHAGRGLGTFLVGSSYSWWMNKHTHHHGNANTVGGLTAREPFACPMVTQLRVH